MASPLLIAALLGGLAGPVEVPVSGAIDGSGADTGAVILASGDCSAAAEQVVAETGGQLLSARPSGDGESCVIIVLIQGSATERPRKIQVKVKM